MVVTQICPKIQKQARTACTCWSTNCHAPTRTRGSTWTNEEANAVKKPSLWTRMITNQSWDHQRNQTKIGKMKCSQTSTPTIAGFQTMILQSQTLRTRSASPSSKCRTKLSNSMFKTSEERTRPKYPEQKRKTEQGKITMIPMSISTTTKSAWESWTRSCFTEWTWIWYAIRSTHHSCWQSDLAMSFSRRSSFRDWWPTTTPRIPPWSMMTK